jgi:hypothetical protein
MGRAEKAMALFVKGANELMDRHSKTGASPDVGLSIGYDKVSISITYTKKEQALALRRRRASLQSEGVSDSGESPADKAAELTDAVAKCGGFRAASVFDVAVAIGKSDDTVRRRAKMYGFLISNNLFVGMENA